MGPSFTTQMQRSCKGIIMKTTSRPTCVCARREMQAKVFFSTLPDGVLWKPVYLRWCLDCLSCLLMVFQVALIKIEWKCHGYTSPEKEREMKRERGRERDALFAACRAASFNSSLRFFSPLRLCTSSLILFPPFFLSPSIITSLFYRLLINKFPPSLSLCAYLVMLNFKLPLRLFFFTLPNKYKCHAINFVLQVQKLEREMEGSRV